MPLIAFSTYSVPPPGIISAASDAANAGDPFLMVELGSMGRVWETHFDTELGLHILSWHTNEGWVVNAKDGDDEKKDDDKKDDNKKDDDRKDDELTNAKKRYKASKA